MIGRRAAREGVLVQIMRSRRCLTVATPSPPSLSCYGITLSHKDAGMRRVNGRGAREGEPWD